MDYSGKKLPTGFIYMLNKKDMKDINNATDNFISSVYLDGTSYSETKMAKNWKWSISVAYIKYDKSEIGLTIHIKLFGIRDSHFVDNEDIQSQKEKIKCEIIDKIKDSIEKYNNHDLYIEYQFVSINLS